MNFFSWLKTLQIVLWAKKLLALWPTNPSKDGKFSPTALVILLFVILLGFTYCTAAHAAEPYRQISAGSTVIRGSSAVIDLSVNYPEAGPGDSNLEVGVTFIGMSNFKGVEQRNNFAWHAALIDGFGNFDVGIGPAYLQNTDTYNGSHLNFVLLMGYRTPWKILGRCPLTVRYQHFSNGGTTDVNKGRDMVFAGCRF